jgi:OmcA/MtrC family decaheme c-type cytochrome
MIHKIHTGAELVQDYTVYGFGRNRINFNEVRYPGDRRNCTACHVGGSEQIPLAANLLPVTDPRGWIPTPGPVTAACTSCHGSREAAAQALVNTAPLGESCATCHCANADFSINRVHAR